MKLLKQNLKIKAVKDRAISAEGKLFSYVDSDFKNWGLKVSGKTEAINVAVYEIDKDGTFKDLFTSLSPNLDSLVMTQGQIIEFVKTHKAEVRDGGWGNFFLMKSNGEYFVAGVRLYSGGGLRVNIYRFSFGNVWLAEYRRRMVVPQLTPGTLETPSPSESLPLEQKIEDVKKAGYVVFKQV